jgi:hypothetical protein
MTDRLFRFLPWAPFVLPCVTLGSKLAALLVGGRAYLGASDVLTSLGMPELLLFWLVANLIVVVHLAANGPLSVAEKREWRRYLLVGGCPAPLIYVCSADRHLPGVQR